MRTTTFECVLGSRWTPSGDELTGTRLPVQVWESLTEGLSKVVSVQEVNTLDYSLDGSLVHIAGPLSNVPVLRDTCAPAVLCRGRRTKL